MICVTPSGIISLCLLFHSITCLVVGASSQWEICTFVTMFFKVPQSIWNLTSVSNFHHHEDSSFKRDLGKSGELTVLTVAVILIMKSTSLVLESE